MSDLSQQPVSISIEADHFSFLLYKTGVLRTTMCQVAKLGRFGVS